MNDGQPADLWVRVIFKGQKVYARSDTSGTPIVSGGMVDVRYGLNAPKIYRGAARNLTPLSEAEAPIEMRPAEPTAPAATKGGVSGRRAGTARKKVDGAEEAVPSPRPGARVAFTDGACSGNPGPAGFGVVLFHSGFRTELSVYLGKATNNIAELGAIRAALQALEERTAPVDIYTDSDYSIGVLTRGWKAKANQELIADLKRLLAGFSDVRLNWVPGHVGVPLNERADELARGAIERKGNARTDREEEPPPHILR